MKKVLSTLLAFVMLATTLMAVPFSAQAATQGSLDIQLAPTASLKTGTNVSASLQDTFTLSAQGGDFSFSIGNSGAYNSYWKGYYADTEYTEAFTLKSGSRYKLQFVLFRNSGSVDMPAELKYRGVKIASFDSEGVPSPINQNVSVSKVAPNAYTDAWVINLTMQELIINNQKGEFVPMGLPQTVTAEPAPEGKHFAGWSGTYHTGSGTQDVTFGDASAMQTTFTMPYTDTMVSVNSSYADHSFTEVITPEKKATCTRAGKTAEMGCTGCDATIPATEISPLGHDFKTVVTKATTSVNGSSVKTCSRCGLDESDPIVIYKIASVKLSATSYTYNGKVKTPSVTVKDSKGKTLVKNTDYTVSYASGRKYVGKYAVKVTFKGKYSGTKTLYFTIKPKATSISSLTAGSKKFTVKWKKQTSQTTGYQVQIATNSKFTKGVKSYTVSKNKTVSKKITKLKGKKKYYVRVRTYKTVKVNGKTVKLYSSWSKAKTVTTKK